MRALVILSLVALSACASSTASTGRPEAETVRIGGPEGGNLRRTSSSFSHHSPDSV